LVEALNARGIPAEDWAELAMLSDAPLAGGENVVGFANFASLISARSSSGVDALRVSNPLCNGLQRGDPGHRRILMAVVFIAP
jgi:L-alanine-DL-glutamate epimerase-like enolase superfamily enzyme